MAKTSLRVGLLPASRKFGACPTRATAVVVRTGVPQVRLCRVCSRELAHRGEPWCHQEQLETNVAGPGNRRNPR